jgi:hypothetical protein
MKKIKKIIVLVFFLSSCSTLLKPSSECKYNEIYFEKIYKLNIKYYHNLDKIKKKKYFVYSSMDTYYETGKYFTELYEKMLNVFHQLFIPKV